MRTLLLHLIFAFSFFYASAQTDLKLGEWKSHLPANYGLEIAVGNSKVFVATDSKILVLDEADIYNPTSYSKVEGLSDVGINKIEYDKTHDQLVIAYENSKIDLFTPESTFSIFDIFRNTTIQGSKKINDLFITDDGNFLYLATGFGILQYNLDRREFGFNTFTSEVVYNISAAGSQIFASTETGCYYFDLNSNLNENFFGDWTLIDETFGVGPLYESRIVENINGKIILNVDNEIFVSNDAGANFSSVYSYDDSNLIATDVSSFNDGWMLTLRHENGQSEVIFFDANDLEIAKDDSCPGVSNGAVQDSEGRIWIADEWRGIRVKNSPTSDCESLEYNGPFSASVSEIDVKNNIVHVATGGVNDNFVASFNKDGFYENEENNWSFINQLNSSLISDVNISSFFKIKAHPTQDKVYCGTYWSGLLEHNRETGELVLFDQFNTTENGLGPTIGDENRTRISGMAFDRDQNLWLANFGSSKALVVYTAGGNWFNFQLESSGNISDIVIDDLGFIWMVVNGNNGGVLVYDIGERLEDPSDDRQEFIRNSDLPRGNARTLAKDLNGEIWLGTTEGGMVFECGFAVFDGDCVPNQPRVLQDSIPAYLLQSESITSIMIDGGNRKWFGTKNGVFVQAPNGEEQIARFDIDNSPIFDNDILDIAFNQITGEVYIGTAKGVLSYRSEATGAVRSHSGNVYAFPNPVNADYSGPIAIKGLAQDANVKITDLNGKLVFETTAIGGQAIWDGNHYDNSSKAAGGVYLVFSSTTNTSEIPDTYVTKILLMR